MRRKTVEAQYRTSANLAARVDLHRQCSTNPQGFQRWVFERLQLAAGQRVLEVGCGTGGLWRDNGERIPSGVGLTLSDRSLGMVAAARDACRGLAGAEGGARAPAPRWTACALPELPFAGGTFDRVVANHMLYHVDERPRALTELRRVLRPGGVLLATTNGEGHLRELKLLMRELAIAPVEVAAAFSLENGESQLRSVFAHVRREDYPDSLRITSPDLVLDYLASLGAAASAAVAARREEMRAAISARIARDGALEVVKVTGAFVAWGG